MGEAMGMAGADARGLDVALSDEVVVVLTATSSQEEADRIAEALVRERLAACCQSSPIRSTYLWKGELCRDAEILLLAKTTTADRAMARIRELHSYELPEIVVVPITGGYAAYLDWVRSSCNEPPAS